MKIDYMIVTYTKPVIVSVVLVSGHVIHCPHDNVRKIRNLLHLIDTLKKRKYVSIYRVNLSASAITEFFFCNDTVKQSTMKIVDESAHFMKM
jgi:hypothetical protein